MAGFFDPLLPRIELAIELYGVSQTRIGYVAANDPTLVQRMRAGRFVKKQALRERIEALLDQIEKDGGLA